ncbi:MAG: hypothetical protein V1921_08995 [Candidatus Altiarchaeota archaeon]
MARPIDCSPDLNNKESMRFVKELIRVESLPKDSREYLERRKFLEECELKAEKVRWVF